ncbi:MAG: hypothetical protein HY231_24520 [Acidobacteria bacterium]|nr:hypothetical protein [Acidobacteriota bacterium]
MGWDCRTDEGYDQATTWHQVIFDEAQHVGVAEYTYVWTHQYHWTVWMRLSAGKISHWREYQHIDPREWHEFVGTTLC